MATKTIDHEFWKKFREDDRYQPIVDCLKRNYEKSSKRRTIGYREFTSFWATGLRTDSDGAYFEREQYYHALLFLALIYPEEENYLEELQELIWSICNEFTWERAAHMDHIKDVAFQEIGLGGSAMAAKLAETSHWLGDRLDEMIKQRIHCEIQRRYLIPFPKREWWWESKPSNWAATCIGCLGIAFMLEFPEEYRELKPRLDAGMENYLRSFSQEGICLEGVGYWTVFGNFLHYAKCLQEFSQGNDDYFTRERIHDIARFLNVAYLKKTYSVSFSDSYPETKCPICVGHLVHECFPDVNLLPLECHGFSAEKLDEHLKWWEITELMMLYFNPDFLDKAKGNEEELELYAPDAGWFVCKKKAYALATKAGHNDEPHNHNDVGSFHLVTGNGQQLADIGPSLYTISNFDPKYRYQVFGNGSLGHSVPVIDGAAQAWGEKYCGEIEQIEDGVKIRFASAYPLKELKGLERWVKCREESVTIRDCFVFEEGNHSVTERFVTGYLPGIKGDTVVFGDVELKVSGGTFCPVVQEFDHIDNSNVVGKKSKVYAVDFKFDAGETAEFEIEIKVLGDGK